MTIDRLFIIPVIAIFMGSCGHNNTAVDGMTDTKTESDTVAIIYSSPRALNAASFDAGNLDKGPLSILDGSVERLVTVDIGNDGAYDFNGKKNYQIMVINNSPDTLEIESIELPDSYFKASFPLKSLIPKAFTGIHLTADSARSLNDYRLIINFSDKKYPSQVIHTNLHPDLIRLRADGPNNGARQ